MGVSVLELQMQKHGNIRQAENNTCRVNDILSIGKEIVRASRCMSSMLKPCLLIERLGARTSRFTDTFTVSETWHGRSGSRRGYSNGESFYCGI